jgi:hypothetical protein
MAMSCKFKCFAAMALAAGVIGLLAKASPIAADPRKATANQAKPSPNKTSSKVNVKRRGRADTKQAGGTKARKAGKNPTGKTGEPESKTEAAKAPPKPVTEWTQEKIDKELAACRETLSKIDAVAIPMQSFRKNKCGAAAPIQLISVGRSPEVVFSPPARVTCKLAGALHKWITDDLQKLAKKHLDAEIIKVEVMSDYSCRNAYGRKGGRLSEHALVNALDIRGFVTSSGKNARLLAHWGPTRRDIATEIAAAKKEAETRRAARDDGDRHASAAGADVASASLEDKAGIKPEDLVKTPKGKKKSVAKLAMANGQRGVTVTLPNAKKPRMNTEARHRRNKGGARASVTKATVPLKKRVGRSGWFLREAHARGCKIFGTILGPEANHAHRNHFHVDMAPRRRSNFCE